MTITASDRQLEHASNQQL